MNGSDLERCYYISKEKIEKLEELGLLDDVTIVQGQRDFIDEDIHQIIEMIHLMELGFNDQDMIDYYTCEQRQMDILKKTRVSICKQMHVYQKKLDEIDYFIYQKEKL